MAVLKIVPGDYVNRDALDRLIHGYVFPKAVQIGGYFVDPQYAAEQMRTVKRFWHQDHGKQLRHFVLSFNPKESAAISHASELAIGAYGVCGYYSEEYQAVFGIHRPNRSTWHIHFVVNNVNFTTGERLPESNRQDYQLRDYMYACHLPAKQIAVCYD